MAQPVYGMTHGPPFVLFACVFVVFAVLVLFAVFAVLVLFAVAIAARAVLLVLYRGDGALWSSGAPTCAPPECVAYLSCTGGVLLLSCVCVCVCVFVFVCSCLCVTSAPSCVGGCCLDAVVRCGALIVRSARPRSLTVLGSTGRCM